MRQIALEKQNERNEPKRHEPDVSLAGSVLVVDDCEANVRLLSRLLVRQGHTVRAASSGEEALRLAASQPPDLVIMDVMMPEKDGFEVCRKLKQQAATRFVPVVLVTALQDAGNKVQSLEAGADDLLTKPVNGLELCARVQSLLRLKRSTDDLESVDSVMMLLAQTIEARDSYTEGHCNRLAKYAVVLGRQLDLLDDDLKALEYGGFLHDIGKIAIPDAVLFKPQALTNAEYDLIKQHTVIGDRLCGGLRSLGRVRSIVRHHHERLDGSGYPDGLRGDEIPLLAQIMGIVDVYDALATARAYKEAFDTGRVHEELRSEAKRGWRRTDLVDAFIAASSQ